MPSLWAASLLLFFAVIAGGIACVDAIGNGKLPGGARVRWDHADVRRGFRRALRVSPREGMVVVAETRGTVATVFMRRLLRLARCDF